MRIQRVVARAFGPLRGETLELAPGMTVVSGANEAGKSSWHAALRLALTGVRRGKGPGTAAERLVAERHRPWDLPDQWEVEARLSLDDGRTIDISQDLAGKVACRAVDVHLGRDVSDEILDGTPDASRWLGLTRDAFAATLSVSQAQILAVADAADDLQEQMQRAAATQGTDATAAEAIAQLEQFRRDAVGADTTAAKGPLRSARNRLAAAQANLAEARRLHSEYLDRSAAVEEADRKVAQAAERLAAAEAVQAARTAAAAVDRLARAEALAARNPGPPPALAERDGQADAVAAVLESWSARPAPPELRGTSSDVLAAQLAALPEAPSGDLHPHPSLVDGLRALDLAEEAIRTLGQRPVQPQAPLPGLDEAWLRALARRLRTPQLPQAAALEGSLERARADLAAAGTSRLRPAGIAAVLAGAAALLLLLSGAALPGAALLAAASGIMAWGWAGDARLRGGRVRLARAEAALAPYRDAAELARRDRAAAEVEARSVGLAADPIVIDDLADRLLAADRDGQLVADWDERHESALARRQAASAALTAGLLERGQAVGDDLRTDYEAYVAACRLRAEQLAAAAQRDSLARELAARQAAESAAERAIGMAADLERRMRELAADVGLDSDSEPDAIAAGLRAWQGRRASALKANEQAIAEWHQLESLLGGRSLEELRAEVDRARSRSEGLLADVPSDAVARAERVADPDAAMAAAREELSTARRQADGLAGNLDARREGLPDVAEAEEACTAAADELHRVEVLARTVDETLRLLRAAEERVHRSLAPVLAEAVGRWLPIVCEGAYREVSVDPADLSVRVKEASTGIWRQARLLSEGTREQIYLLLRLAMAEHLVTTGETAPLLLDEVTAQADPDRKRQLLGVLHRLSAERQIVLFSHDDDVLAWAERALEPPRDAIVRLARRPGLAAAARAIPGPMADRGAAEAVLAPTVVDPRTG